MPTLKISDHALNNAEAYARLADQQFGGVECMGFLAGDPDCDLIDTAILAPQQQVSATSVTVTPQAILAAGRELERLGKQAKGWWHSHGRLPTFHSGTDDANSRQLLTQIGYLNHIERVTPLTGSGVTPDGRLQFHTANGQQRMLTGLPLPLARQVAAATPTLCLHQSAATVYSLVVNARGDTPYAERLSEHACPFCGQIHLCQERLSLEIMPAAQAQPLNLDDLLVQVSASISLTPSNAPPVAPPAAPLSWPSRAGLAAAAPGARLVHAARLVAAEEAAVNERYARQSLIPHWQQQRLAEARVVVIGSGILAGSIAWGLAALGVGTIYLCDDRRVTRAGADFPWLDGRMGETAVAALARTLHTLNPDITAYPIGLRLLYDAHAAALPNADLLIEATHDHQSRLIAQAYAQRQGIPLIAVAASGSSGLCQTCWPDKPVNLRPFLLYQQQAQGVATSLVIGGLAVQEARQLLHPLPADEPTPTAAAYAHQHPGRFQPSGIVHRESLPRPRHALLVGAGALGNFVALGLALSGLSRLTIVDPDVIEESNLNRQPLFYEAIRQPKATTLAARLRQFAPEFAVTGLVAPVEAAHLTDVDLILAGVDNFATRAWLNRQAMARRIPLINGGSSPFAGEVQVYAPGQTACLDCTLDVTQLAAAEAGERARCGQAPEASVVIANQIVGGLMVGEACCAADYCPATLVFDATQPTRLGLRSPRAACACHLEVSP